MRSTIELETTIENIKADVQHLSEELEYVKLKVDELENIIQEAISR